MLDNLVSIVSRKLLARRNERIPLIVGEVTRCVEELTSRADVLGGDRCNSLTSAC